LASKYSISLAGIEIFELKIDMNGSELKITGEMLRWRKMCKSEMLSLPPETATAILSLAWIMSLIADGLARAFGNIPKQFGLVFF